ncbi:MAG: hypothetical protein ACE5KE_08970, partial [Methanosarcinales archaeon]
GNLSLKNERLEPILSGITSNKEILFYNRRSDNKINVKVKKGFNLIKESFFSKWKAELNGRELKIYPTYHECPRDGDVQLHIGRDTPEIVGGILSILGYISLFYFWRIRPR